MVAQAPQAQAPAAISWRTLSNDLWVARRDGRHLGSVQRGRRWIAADAESEPIGAFRSFGEAQAAVADPGPARAPIRSRPVAPVLVLAALAAVVAMTASVWPVLVG